MDGVELTVNQEFTELSVDQIVDVPGRRLTKRDLQITTNLAEPTLDNLVLAMNGGTELSGGTGATAFESVEPVFATSATQPTYKALILDGYSVASRRRRVIVRKALSTDNVSSAYKKDEQTVFSVTFSAHYVTPSIAPFKIVDEAAAA